LAQTDRFSIFIPAILTPDPGSNLADKSTGLDHVCDADAYAILGAFPIKARQARGSLCLSARDVPWRSHRKNTNKSTRSQDGWNTMPRKSGKTHVRLSRKRWRKRTSGHETWPRLASPINAKPPSFGIGKQASPSQTRWCGRIRELPITFENRRNQGPSSEEVWGDCSYGPSPDRYIHT